MYWKLHDCLFLNYWSYCDMKPFHSESVMMQMQTTQWLMIHSLSLYYLFSLKDKLIESNTMESDSLSEIWFCGSN